MAKSLADGVTSVEDSTAELVKAVDAKLEHLLSCDALVIGTPVHMGSIDWRVKKFIDTVCSVAWMQDKLIGKVGAVLASGSGYGNAGGGCELAMLSVFRQYCGTRPLIVPLPKKLRDIKSPDCNGALMEERTQRI